MKKKRIEQNEIKRYFLIIAAFLSFMILSLLFFLSWLQQDVEVSSRKTVATNVERQSYHLKSVLDIQFNYLTGMASYMGEREDLFCQENKRLIQSIVKEQDLDLIGIMKADGDTYYNNGARKNVKNRGYFKKVMQGQKIMSQPLESKVDGRTKVILFAVIGVGVITFFILIFQRTSMKQKKMREIASRDGLTQLYNKAGTEQRIKEWLHSDRSKAGAVLMMMDIDYFKQINDTYGHAVGDRVLYKVGHLLKSSFRENDIVGRIGGDEFLIFMEGITSEEFAVRRMENLQQYFRELPIEELEEHTLTCSMGAAFMPKDGTTFGELYKHADEALYTTKRNGRDGFRIYHEVEEKEV